MAIQTMLFSCKLTLFICILSLSTIIINANNAKLNVPRVLLPIFNDFSTNFTLEVSDHGCYKWSASRLDIIQIIPIELNNYLGCSLKAVVSTITKESTRNTVIVLAEDVSSNLVLRCDIIVDVISSLNIVTTTREIFMEEAPEMFEVRAFDDQGNKFSTLEGVEFQWSIVGSVSSSKGTPVLKFITFYDSPYETPASIAKFDTLGLKGHIVLIEGITTGSAKVSVELPHKEYRRVPKTEVQLSVVANLLLDPSDVYIMRGDKVTYKLFQMQHGKLEEIALPSAQYYLEVENEEITQLGEREPAALGLKMGQTKIYLRDKNVDISEVGVVSLPIATITVTEPAYLLLSLLPHRNWAVLENQLCSVLVEAYNSDNHKIHIGDAVQIRTSIPDQYFSVRYKTNNGSLIHGRTIMTGTARIISTLDSVRGPDGTVIKFHPPISTQADLVIYPLLTVEPKKVVLPWDPYHSNKYEIQLKAKGGDGNYWWNSKNNSIASVNQGGIVRVQGLGEVEIIAAMQRNQQNQASAVVHVLSPTLLEVVGHSLEAQIMKPIYIQLALYADIVINDKLVRMLFTDCQNLQFRIKVWDDNFYHDVTLKSEPIEGACGTIAIIGRKMGSSKVTISYHYGDIVLETSTNVSVFKALEVLQPKNLKTVLSLGASRHIVWIGGPRAWFGRPAEHKTNITSSSDIVTVTEIPPNGQTDMYVFSVVCIKLGETDVTLDVINTPTDVRYSNLKSSSTLKVICAKPRYIFLQAETFGDESCPLHSDSSSVIKLSYKPVMLNVIIKDQQKRIFDNATSLLVDWALSKKVLGTVQFDGSILLAEKFESNYLVPLKHYQIIIPKNRTGTLNVISTVAGYKRNLLKELYITPEYPVFGVVNEDGHEETPIIDTSLSIMFVNDTTISPEVISVFNHPQNKVTLTVSQGSGYYKVEQSSSEVADVQYLESSHSVEIFPKTDGLLILRLIDLCLPSNPVVAEVQVLKVGSMKVDMLECVEKGKTIIATLRLYDSAGNALAVAHSELLELRTHVESNVVTMKRLANETPSGEVKYEITGVELGNTFITFISGNDAREIRSQPQAIQVFSPLQLIPQNITIVVGSSFQLSSVGGPQPGSSVEYVSTDTALAKVNSAGLVEGTKIGDLQIIGMAVGYKKNSGDKIIYSKDLIYVHVVPLEGIKIHSPLSKIFVGSKMPIWAKGVPEKITPMVLGSIQPNLLFKWTLSSPDIAELQDVLHDSGIEVPEKDRVSMRLLALKPGRVSLNLIVIMKSGLRPWTEFSHTLELEVFEELKLVKPPAYTSSLLMAPDTQLHLRTNKDSVSGVAYKLIGSSPTGVLNQTSISRSGVVTSHSTLGHSSVLITSVEDNGIKQAVSLHIEVKPVQYIMLNVRTKLYINPNKPIFALPRGLDLELFVTYHDNRGTVFSAVRSDMKIHTNRLDKVHVKRGEVNGTITLGLVNNGQAMLKVSDLATAYKSEDYFKLTVNDLISPAKNEMTVGDIACFSMPLLNENGETGIWTSAHPDVIIMDLPSGIARIRAKTGSALITYTLSNTITASTSVEVLPIHTIVFLHVDVINLTNWGLFSAPLLLLNERESMEKSSNLLSQDGRCHTLDYKVPSSYFPFSCEIRFNSPMTPVDVYQVFSVEPHFSIESGLYSCRFKPVSPPSVNTSVLLSNVTLRAISGGIVSEPLVLPFLPAAYVHSTDIYLNDKHLSDVITVTAVPQVLPQILVFPSDTNLLSVSVPDKVDPNTMKYEIRVNEDKWTPMNKQEVLTSVFLWSPLTNQNITISVIISVRSGIFMSQPCLGKAVDAWGITPLTASIAFYSQAATVIISLIIIALISVYVYVKCFQHMKDPTPTFIYGGTPNMSPTRLSNSDMNSSFLYRQPFSDIEPVYGNPAITRQSPERMRRSLR